MASLLRSPARKIDFSGGAGLPFQIGVAESHFVKPPVKIFKAGSHLSMDDYPTNRNLLSGALYNNSFKSV